jgi:hypothetical protein
LKTKASCANVHKVFSITYMLYLVWVNSGHLDSRPGQTFGGFIDCSIDDDTSFPKRTWSKQHSIKNSLRAKLSLYAGRCYLIPT